MEQIERYYRESDHYRAWIDASGNGSVRILKRINFRGLIHLFKEMLTEMKKTPEIAPRITFYISQSLNEEMSDNAKEFIEFCRHCMSVELDLVVLE
ncbi:MAG TPA: hypothetical protein VMC84_07040 [Methanocella sp.]|uniref:hypothetical protein n=1 Tax=Methanocella sp. TaxID=2052833 RepID=UPI002C31948F|nr:hypothetical protein [Methanocella sp.]HTY90918.1 hypothetical protein [Methanocella sp.]